MVGPASPLARPHLKALRRFALTLTLFNIAGHTLLGFEQSYAQVLVALATAYGLEITLELVRARSENRSSRFATRDLRSLVDALLSAHITGLAVSMLLYANDRLAPIAFASAVAICSKSLLQVRIGDRRMHVFNPSNLGITVTLLALPWVGIAPPYMFTRNLGSLLDWLLPIFIVALGFMLNAQLTRKLPLISGWLGGFALQAFIRSVVFGMPIAAPLAPMTGVAFLLFTFYMVTDPATTPSKPRRQVLFGASVAATYGVLMTAHVVFGLFFALTAVCAARGAAIAIRNAMPLPLRVPLVLRASTHAPPTTQAK